MQRSMMEMRAIEETDWAATWQILEPVFRAGEAYPYALYVTGEEVYQVWGRVPFSSYVAGEANNEILGAYYIKPSHPALGGRVSN